MNSTGAMHSESDLFDDNAWFNAVTLTERSHLFTQAQRSKTAPEADPDRAQTRLKRWRAKPPFEEEDLYAQWLDRQGLTEDELLAILGMSTETIGALTVETPAWVTTLKAAFLAPDIDSLATELVEQFPILALVKPLIAHSIAQLRGGIAQLRERYPTLPFNTLDIESILLQALPGMLSQRVYRTLVLEVNVARLQGLLEGDTPEARYRNFVAKLSRRDFALTLLQEYPVLARQAILCLERWVAVNLEFLEHLCADWLTLKAMFSPDADPGLLKELEGGAGDTHRGGRAVKIARFESGLRLVYKPRSMAVDVHFQGLLRWLNAHSGQPAFRTLAILERERYGWVEFAAPSACETEEDVRSFYQRLGGLMALLFALEATDFHYENIIAAGAHPVLIDLESLFHPRVRKFQGHFGVDMPANRLMDRSVLRMGILPRRIWRSRDTEGIDISGLSSPAGQLTPSALPSLEKVGTDEMHVVRRRVEMQEGQNQPKLDTEAVSLTDYVAEIADGFRGIYQLLLEHRETLLAQGGPITAFANDEMRVLLRPTRQYAELLMEGFHPNVLRDALDRDYLFNTLWNVTTREPHYAEVIPHEQADMWQGDIPIFTTEPASRDLWTGNGACIPDFYEESGLEGVCNCFRRLDEEDMERQVWFIYGSIATSEKGLGRLKWPSYRPVPADVPPEPAQLLDAARAVGDRLSFLALRDESSISWMGLTMLSEKNWYLMPVGVDMYAGLPGIVLFLAYLGAVTEQESYTDLARLGLRTMNDTVAHVKDQFNRIGAFEGWGSQVYLLAHLGTLWNEPDLFEQAEEYAGFIKESVAEDTVLDIIGGAAGGLGCLLSLYRVHPSEIVLEAAVACGERLVEAAQPMEHGVGWVKEHYDEALAGFSHGATGIAWALFELAALTGDERYRATALQGLAYERSLFSEEYGNWPDLRDDYEEIDEDMPKFMTAWCHGAPGVGLGRLRIWPHHADEQVRADIDVAIKTTLWQGFGGNHSLCHGDLGNLDLLVQAREVLGEADFDQQILELTGIIWKSIQHHGWLTGVPLGVETPGLMNGIAGIGYQLLRLAAPDRVPSVLTLGAPIPAAEAVQSEAPELTLA